MCATRLEENGLLPVFQTFMGSNQSGMRAHNERLVLSLVRRHTALSKAEIARISGLSAQTVSVIMRRLEEEGLLVRDQPVRGKVGQPSVPMRLAPDGARFLGLKVGRRSSELITCDFLGDVKDRVNIAYPYPTPDSIRTFARESIEATLNKLTPDQRERIAGLGIAMPFFLWNWAKWLHVAEEDMADWARVDIRSDLQALFDFPVFLENDATAACGAEVVFGPADGPSDFLYFYIGFFVGGGLVLNGRPFSGNGNAGALGPLPVIDDAGRPTQLIDVASLSVLEREMQAAGQASEALWLDTKNWNVDPKILSHWLQGAADGLAHAIVSACSLIDFRAVKIDGWIPAGLRDDLVTAVERSLDKRNLTGIIRPEVIPGAIGPDARALGAASLPLSSKFLTDTVAWAT